MLQLWLVLFQVDETREQMGREDHLKSKSECMHTVQDPIPKNLIG